LSPLLPLVTRDDVAAQVRHSLALEADVEISDDTTLADLGAEDLELVHLLIDCDSRWPGIPTTAEPRTFGDLVNLCIQAATR
jgi:hypothetical protein